MLEFILDFLKALFPAPDPTVPVTLKPVIPPVPEIVQVPLTPISNVKINLPFTKALSNRKSSRHLHPDLRLALEQKLFVNGIPQVFLDKNIPQVVILVAKAMEAIKIFETGQNHGKFVAMIQSIIGSFTANGNGDAWCMSTDQCIVAFIEDYYQVESSLPASESCVDDYNAAIKIPGIVSQTAEIGTFFDGEHGTTGNGHTGTCIEILAGGKMTTIEGNTTDPSGKDGPQGVYIRVRDQKQNGDLKTLGFLRVYPNNILPTKTTADRPTDLPESNHYGDNGVTLLTKEYSYLWKNCVVTDSEVISSAKKALTNKSRYQTVADKVGCPWFFIAVIHFREASFNWASNIANGDPWNKVTTHVPAGRGPFNSWEDAAIDAMKYEGYTDLADWSMGTLFHRLEGYNGWGYRTGGVKDFVCHKQGSRIGTFDGTYHGSMQDTTPKNASPYIYNRTPFYQKGVSIEDHSFYKDAIDDQVGCMAFLKALENLGEKLF